MFIINNYIFFDKIDLMIKYINLLIVIMDFSMVKSLENDSHKNNTNIQDLKKIQDVNTKKFSIKYILIPLGTVVIFLLFYFFVWPKIKSDTSSKISLKSKSHQDVSEEVSQDLSQSLLEGSSKDLSKEEIMDSTVIITSQDIQEKLREITMERLSIKNPNPTLIKRITINNINIEIKISSETTYIYYQINQSINIKIQLDKDYKIDKITISNINWDNLQSDDNKLYKIMIALIPKNSSGMEYKSSDLNNPQQINGCHSLIYHILKQCPKYKPLNFDTNNFDNIIEKFKQKEKDKNGNKVIIIDPNLNLYLCPLTINNFNHYYIKLEYKNDIRFILFFNDQLKTITIEENSLNQSNNINTLIQLKLNTFFNNQDSLLNTTQQDHGIEKLEIELNDNRLQNLINFILIST
jgi:hypothetical protein